MLEYTNEEFGRIRVELITSKTYFYAADVCRILGKGTWTGTYTQRYAGKEHIKQIKNGLKKANLIDFDGVMNLCEKAQAKTSNLLREVAERITFYVEILEESFNGTRYLPLFKDEHQDYENAAGDFKVFHHPIFGKIRATLIDENMYFYSTDICRALGFKRYGSVYTNRYAGEENLKQIVSESMRGTRCINVISIAGVRNLCQRSKLSPDTISDFSNWLHNATKQEKKPDATDREKPEEAVKEPLEETAEGKVDALFEKAVENLKNKAEEEKAAVEEKQVVDSNFTTFQNAEFGEIRTEVINGEPWFCLADVCKSLELTAKVVNQRLSDEVVSKYPIIDTLGRTQEALFVNEDGLYDVILESRKENARKFRKWVTGEVLPSIRKTGGYQKPLTPLEQIQVIAQGTIELAQKVEKLERNSTQLERNLNQLEHDMPLYGCEIDEVQQHVKRKGVQCLGGKDSEAYADGSIRSQVYKDIYSQLKREYGCVSTYKSIKRKYIADVHDFIDCYQLPTVLEEQITAANAQQRLF